MDARFVGRPGSTPTGQYASAFDRGDNEQILQRMTADVDGAMAHITGSKARNDRVLDPQPFTVNGKETFVIRFFVSIVNPRTNEVVGGVGCFIDIALIQPVVANTINSHEEISGITIYASNGMILGHTVPARVGKMLLDVDTIYGSYMREANQAVLDGKEFQCRTFSPALNTNVETLILSFPIGTSDETWSILMVVSEKHILKEVNAITKFTIILAAIAITAAAVNQITANIQSIKGRVMNQSASVTETNATMEQVVANINKLNGHVENQSNNISQASSAIEQMVANINSVTGTLVNNAANVSALKEASEVGRGGLKEVSGDIQETSRESEGLMEINAVMENIASQTNLLSMNAAIEAAHAGEAGKGFAVVADEIRKLAESSSEQSKTIGNVLKKIKESIDKITKSTENVLNKFEAIDTGVKTVSQQEENIRSAMEEQGEGSKQILQSTSGLNELTRQVKSGSVEMLEGSKEVMNESQNLSKITDEITGGMNEMASGAAQINIAVHNVNEMTNKNREAIDNLIQEVSRFKVE
jgi:methyl-accepting chemotaxis protein